MECNETVLWSWTSTRIRRHTCHPNPNRPNPRTWIAVKMSWGYPTIRCSLQRVLRVVARGTVNIVLLARRRPRGVPRDAWRLVSKIWGLHRGYSRRHVFFLRGALPFHGFLQKRGVVIKVRIEVDLELLCSDVPLWPSFCTSGEEKRVPF